MRVKNNKATADTWAGQELQPAQEYDIQSTEIAAWQSSDKVIQDASLLHLLIGDATSYKSTGAEAVAFLLQTKSDVSIEYLPAFAAKTILVNGVTKKLFKRVHGIHATIPANSTANIDFTVPYATAKFSGAELIGCSIGDVLDYTVHDDANNTYSQAPVGVVGPNYQLNKFGYAVHVPDGFYQNTSNYDADIYAGMIIRCTYTNNSNAAKYIAMNVWLHEVKA